MSEVTKLAPVPTTPTDFKTTLTTIVQKLVCLDVMTIVTPNQKPDPDQPAEGAYLLTRINLVEGDIRFEVTDTMLDRQIHCHTRRAC